MKPKATMKIYLLFATIFLLSFHVHAQILRKDHLEVRLIAPTNKLTESFRLGVHFKIDPEWHIYWKNPGDSGASPKFEFTGGELKRISWPYPARLPLGDLTNFGYEHEVVILLDLMAYEPQTKINLEWLVCKVECVPGFAEFEINNRTVAIEPELFLKYEKLVPAEVTRWESNFIRRSAEFVNFELLVSNDEIAKIKTLFIFPENGSDFQTQLAKIESAENHLKIAVPISPNAQPDLKIETFTFVIHKMNGAVESVSQKISLQKAPPSILWGIVLAFLGGMILNLMPCVFPVLFLKAFSFLKEDSAQVARRTSWHYALGVIISFIVFGGLLSALRYSGEAIGWGFQLQNPLIVYLLALLFFAMALNFFGFFEMGNSLTLQTSKLGSLKFFNGSFGTGVLAVIVASPCTAPFMGTALGLALLLPAYLSILIFISLGLGMAVPMVVLAHIPRLIEIVPRSGPWMIVVKQLMSFPLLATGIWLLWILGNQKGSDAVFFALGSFLIFTMGLWILNVGKKKVWTWVAITLLIFGPLLTLIKIRAISLETTSSKANGLWISYDDKTIAEKKLVQPIFIDFTAAWCITCQVNKRTVLHTDEIQKLFKEHNVLLMQADWTNHDALITNALARFERNSVPLYIFYNKVSEPQILPEILTQEVIRDLFK